MFYLGYALRLVFSVLFSGTFQVQKVKGLLSGQLSPLVS